MLNDHPLGPSSNRSLAKTALQFCLMGPKLHINTSKVASQPLVFPPYPSPTSAEISPPLWPQVVVGRRPVTGMRLHLEGKKNDRSAVERTDKVFLQYINGDDG